MDFCVLFFCNSAGHRFPSCFADVFPFVSRRSSRNATVGHPRRTDATAGVPGTSLRGRPRPPAIPAADGSRRNRPRTRTCGTVWTRDENGPGKLGQRIFRARHITVIITPYTRGVRNFVIIRAVYSVTGPGAPSVRPPLSRRPPGYTIIIVTVPAE